MVIVDTRGQDIIVPQAHGAVFTIRRKEPIRLIIRNYSTRNASGAEMQASSWTVGAIKGQKRVLVVVIGRMLDGYVLFQVRHRSDEVGMGREALGRANLNGSNACRSSHAGKPVAWSQNEGWAKRPPARKSYT